MNGFVFIKKCFFLMMLSATFFLGSCYYFIPIQVKQRMVIDDDQQVNITYSGEFNSFFEIMLASFVDENSESEKKHMEPIQKEIDNLLNKKYQNNHSLKKTASGKFEIQLSEAFKLNAIPDFYLTDRAKAKNKSEPYYLSPVIFSHQNKANNLQLVDGMSYKYHEYTKTLNEELETEKSKLQSSNTKELKSKELKSIENFQQLITQYIEAYRADIEIEIHPKWVKTIQGKTLTPAEWDALPNGQNGRKIISFQRKGYSQDTKLLVIEFQ